MEGGISLMIDPNKPTYTITEFAALMGVSYNSVRYWLKKGLVPGAYQQGGEGTPTIARWRIPAEALKMQKPKWGRPFKGGIIKSKEESKLLFDARQELAELNQRHMKLMEDYAGLRGRCERLEKELALQQVDILPS
jgi:hypothetical protein